MRKFRVTPHEMTVLKFDGTYESYQTIKAWVKTLDPSWVVKFLSSGRAVSISSDTLEYMVFANDVVIFGHSGLSVSTWDDFNNAVQTGLLTEIND